MNPLSFFLRTARVLLPSVLQTNNISRGFSIVYQKCSLSSFTTQFTSSRQLLMPSIIKLEQTRAYQPRGVPKLRCRHCYFVTRHGQLFVECSSKKRHRQFQIIGKSGRFKDDLTEGKYKNFVYQDYKHRRFYRLGESRWTKSDLVGDRIGNDL